MRLLLDSHILLWYDTADARLPAATVRNLRSLQDSVFVSTASVWELSIKRSLGKLSVPESLIRIVERNGFQFLPVSPQHAERVATLPHHHGDPFDRMLVAQAIIEGLTLVTHDATLAQYDVPLLQV